MSYFQVGTLHTVVTAIEGGACGDIPKDVVNEAIDALAEMLEHCNGIDGTDYGNIGYTRALIRGWIETALVGWGRPCDDHVRICAAEMADIVSRQWMLRLDNPLSAELLLMRCSNPDVPENTAVFLHQEGVFHLDCSLSKHEGDDAVDVGWRDIFDNATREVCCTLEVLDAHTIEIYEDGEYLCSLAYPLALPDKLLWLAMRLDMAHRQRGDW